jgi:hypothetical protein
MRRVSEFKRNIIEIIWREIVNVLKIVGKVDRIWGIKF